jgi:hypothetical protein
VWPFVAFVPVLAGRLLGRLGVVAAGLLVLLVMAPAGQQFASRQTRLPDPARVLDAAHRIVLDSIDRGDLPRATLFVPDRSPVYVDGQSELIARARDWLPALRPGDLYISFKNGSGYVPGDRERLLALLSSRFDVVPVAGGVWDVGTIYRLQPKTSTSG